MTDPAAITALARVMSATAGLLVSGGDASAVNAAASMGANAAENNALLHPNQIALVKSRSQQLAGTDGLSATQWEQKLTRQLLYQSDSLFSGVGNDPQAAKILSAVQNSSGVSMSAMGAESYTDHTQNISYVPSLMGSYAIAAPNSPTIFLGGNNAAVVVGGPVVGAGVYLNPGLGTSLADAGSYTSYGAGYGVDLGYSATLGFNQGSVDNFKGSATNINVGINAGVSGGITTIVTNGNVTGGAINFGGKAIPGGALSVVPSSITKPCSFISGSNACQ
jgi:hypothetical protein